MFGNPTIFFKYPPNTSDEQAREYDRIAEEMIGDGRGGYPDGGDIKTVETTARGGDTFKQRCEWCDKQIVRRGTGGELTMLAESGSGTLAGNAHQETFRMLSAGEGAEISENFNRQMSRRLLDRHFPGRPRLAYWTLEYEEAEDVGKQVDNITKLAAAGYIADEEEVSEASGYTVSLTGHRSRPRINPPSPCWSTAETLGKSPPRQNANSAGNGDNENLLTNYGTSEGAKKGWDNWGRGRHEAIGKIGTAKSLGLEKLSELKPDPASSHSHPGRARKALTRGFTARSIDGQDVRFGKSILELWDSAQPPKTPQEQQHRLYRLSEAVRAVKNPHEVWEAHNGQKTYLRVYEDRDGKFAMSGFITGNDGQVRSFFHQRRLNGAEKMRKGTLKYKR